MRFIPSRWGGAERLSKETEKRFAQVMERIPDEAFEAGQELA